MKSDSEFLRFEYLQRDGLHTYVARAGEGDLPGPVWPGLWELDYPHEPDGNPWRRHAINNNDGEALAVWRAFAWALTAGRTRLAIPAYYRDDAARLLGVDRHAVLLVRWEYDVDVEQPEWTTADHGFVPARACVPLRPSPDAWEQAHARFAGLFPVSSFRQLTDLHLAVAGDATSEITLFGLAGPGRTDSLVAALNQADRPVLADILEPGDVVVDLAVVHDLGAGAASYLSVRATEPLIEVDLAVDHFRHAFGRYLDQASRIHTFEDFHTVIDNLLAAPSNRA